MIEVNSTTPHLYLMDRSKDAIKAPPADGAMTVRQLSLNDNLPATLWQTDDGRTRLRLDFPIYNSEKLRITSELAFHDARTRDLVDLLIGAPLQRVVDRTGGVLRLLSGQFTLQACRVVFSVRGEEIARASRHRDEESLSCRSGSVSESQRNCLW